MAPLILPGQTTQQPQYPAPLVPAYANDVTLSVNFAGGSRNSVTDQTATGVYTEAVNAQGKAYKNVGAGGGLSWPVKSVIGTDKWTLLFHFYLPVYDATARGLLQIASNASAASTSPFLLLQSNGSNGLTLFVDGGFRITAASVFADRTYHSIAVTYDGATVTLIRNGAVIGTYASTNLDASFGHYTSDTLWVATGYPAAADIESLAVNYATAATPVDQLIELTSRGDLWGIFSAPPRRIWLPGATVQILRPASDITAGAWTPSAGGSLFGTINETPFNDTTYNTTPSASTFEVKLGAATAPGVTTGHIARYRAQGTGGLTVRLMQGATVIATNAPSITAAYQTFTFTLSGAEAAAITDYSDLRLRFTST